MNKKIVTILLAFLTFIVLGSNKAFADDLNYKIVENVHRTKNLRTDENTNLNNLDLLSSTLFILNDKYGDYYFCIDESKYYPSNLDYMFKPAKEIDPNIITIVDHFYADLSGDTSPLDSYKNESFETKYAATQIAIWTITNSSRFEGDQEKIITENKIIQDILSLNDDNNGDESISSSENDDDDATISSSEDDDDDTSISSSEDDDDDTSISSSEDDDDDTSISSSEDDDDDTSISSSEDDDDTNSRLLRNSSYTFNDAITDAEKMSVTLSNLEFVQENNNDYIYQSTFTIEGLNDNFQMNKESTDVAIYSTVGYSRKEITDECTINFNYDDNKILIGVPKDIAGGSNTTLHMEVALYIETYNEYYTVYEPQDSRYQPLLTKNKISKKVSDDTSLIIEKVENIEISGSKVWVDENNSENTRPDTIKLILYANNDIKEVLELSGDTQSDSWEFTFSDLPVYDEQGVKIEYRVVEEAVPNYQSDRNGTEIINTYNPGKTSVTINKVWNDKNNQDGVRPEAIEVKLLANGKDMESKVVLNAENNWTHTWTDLNELDSENQEIIYSVQEIDVPDGYEVSIDDTVKGNVIITNTYIPETINIQGEKYWDDNDDIDEIRPESIKIDLLANGKYVHKNVVVSQENNWTYSFNNLPKYEGGEEIIYIINEQILSSYTTSHDGYNLINTYNPDKTNMTVIKKWADENDKDKLRPESITVELFADGASTQNTAVLDASNGWTHTWSDLIENDNGRRIVYSVKETNVPSGYNSSIQSNSKWAVTITNTHTPDNSSSEEPIEPSPEEPSYEEPAEPSPEEPAEPSPEEPAEPSPEEPAEPSPEESTEPSYEEPSPEIPIGPEETININGEKKWEDNNNQDGVRPDFIEIDLLGNGKVIQENIRISATDDWKYSFVDLPKYENGQKIVYTVIEHSITNYSTNIDGYDLTNKYTPGKTNVTVSKIWDDYNNQDGIRPNSIEIELFANGKATNKKETLNADNNWTYTWEDLDEKIEGEEIIYSVNETKVPVGYEASVNNHSNGNIIITNTHIPETINITGEKKWEDNDNQDGLRPDFVEINLLANGKPVQENVKVSNENDWTYSFANLPKYEQGEEIVYTISENNVLNYSTTIKGYNITNKYTPGKTTATVTKYWKDQQNMTQMRPKNIKVQLYADGEEVGNPVKLNDQNNWTYTWQNLDISDDGTSITYTVKELDVPDKYIVDIADNNIGNMIITNTFPYVEECVEPNDNNTNSNNDPSDNNDEYTHDDSLDLNNYSNDTYCTNSSNYVLPQTGESSSMIYILVGYILMVSSCYIFFYKYLT